MFDLLHINKIKDQHIVCVGDIMLDSYIFGSTNRISPEAPIPVVSINKKENRLGGVGNVAKNLLDLGAKVTMIASVGKDIPATEIKALLKEYKNLTCHLFVDKKPTTNKTRVLAGLQHVVRIDQEDTTPISSSIEQKIINVINSIDSAKTIIVSDYCKGTITEKIAIEIGISTQFTTKIVDSKRTNLDCYNKYTVYAPNQKELETVLGHKVTEKNIVETVKLLGNRFNYVIMTCGADGMLATNGYMPWAFPAIASDVVDVSGAGDTVVAMLAISLDQNQSISHSLHIASRAAAIVVSKTGTASLTIQEFRDFKKQSRIWNDKDLSSIEAHANDIKNQGKTIAVVNGCFDLFHAGHLNCLELAATVADHVIVCLNDDDYIKRKKNGPVFDQNHRAHLVAGIKGIDDVIVFSTETPEPLLRVIGPTYVVKGEEYQNQDWPEKAMLLSIGCKIVYNPIITHSSDIIKRIKEK